MSKCVVHMMKIKSGGVGGIQSHNQREHESKKNKEIDYSKSSYNLDLINSQNINYRQQVKSRINDLNLPKAIRKDATVYTSFIVSSDKNFFVNLGEREHIKRSVQKNESISLGLMEPTPFEYLDEAYREDCIREGSIGFFEKATEFFQERYGAENVINATIHFDESTPHMHIGVVPIINNRLSAKALFTKVELTNLQTDFAREVGKPFDLERGVHGSENTHLNEIDFKLKMRKEKLDQNDNEIFSLNEKIYDCKKEISDLKKQSEVLTQDVQSLNKTFLDLQVEVSTLNNDKKALKGKIEALKDDIKVLDNIKVEKTIKSQQGVSMDAWNESISVAKSNQEKEKRYNLLEKFVNLPQIKPIFDKFCEAMQKVHTHTKTKENQISQE